VVTLPTLAGVIHFKKEFGYIHPAKMANILFHAIPLSGQLKGGAKFDFSA